MLASLFRSRVGSEHAERERTVLMPYRVEPRELAMFLPAVLVQPLSI